MSDLPTVSELAVSRTATIREVLEAIDRTAQGSCFLIDEDEMLVGVVTDGDIRRGLLEGATLETEIHQTSGENFVSLPASASDVEIQETLSSTIRHIPLVDEEGRLVDYASRHKYRRFPIMEPSLEGNELAYVTECIETNWISSQGRFVHNFERMVADYCGVEHALAVSNGTVALHLALEALGIGEGDEVIVPDLTFAASINAVLHANATPVLVDIRRDTWCIDPEKTREAVTERTRAIMPVHLYGQPCDMDALGEIAADFDLAIIEDAAEAIGSRYKGKPVGAFGDAATFSFYGNKTITTGEGGILLLKDEDVHARAAQLRDHGMSPEKRYWHHHVGYNYRMTNMQAAVGVAQMERIRQIVDRKVEIAEWYVSRLGTVEALKMPVDKKDRMNTHWLFTAALEDSANMSRDRILRKMKQNAIDLRPVFFPLHEMPIYKPYASGRFPNATRVSRRGLSFPSSLTLKETDIDEISRAFLSTMKTADMLAPA